MKNVADLFHKRDEAVRKKDRALFLSTQIEEIKGVSWEGYLQQAELSSSLLATVNISRLTQLALIKETYRTREGNSRDAFLIYFLVNTSEGWKIYRAVY